MDSSSPAQSVSDEIINMFDNNFLPKKSPPKCTPDFLCIEYENVEYIDEEFIVEQDEEVAIEAVDAEENIETFYEFDDVYDEAVVEEDKCMFKGGHDFAVGLEEVSYNDAVCEEVILVDENLKDVPYPAYPVSLSSENGNLPTKKRKKNPEMWKSNIRKRQRESGQQYKSTNNEDVAAKTMKPPCKDCSFNCTNIFTAEERLNIFKSFWSLTDNEKSSFYFKFVVRDRVKRHRIKSKEITKKFSFKYSFEKNQSIYRVCRVFFLNTLSIDQKRIYYCFKNFKNKSGSPILRRKGKNVKRVTATEKQMEVREHISSFQAVESHYCRASSSKKYLDSSLNLSKMYNLYIQKYENPVSINIYRKIFNNEFNISFHKPKKDQCDKCALYHNKENVPPEEKFVFEEHCLEKVALKADRDIDRNNTNPTTCIVCYDLQSVFSLPKGNASAFYYKRKLSMYNLTATIIIPNVKPFTYCALWTEAHSGRSGNDIASGLIKILNELVKDYPELETVILWSDSCVPQNKNKINTTAIKMFLKSHKQITTIIQKFSEPGHSLIQEVDCVHSVIDVYLKNIEIHSPIHLIWLLKNMPSNKTQLKILEMDPTDFYSYSSVATKLDYSKIPFSKIKVLIYKKNEEFQIQFKNSAREVVVQNETILKSASKKCLKTPLNVFQQNLTVLPQSTISNEKKKDIRDLLIFLPINHQNYFKSLLNI